MNTSLAADKVRRKIALGWHVWVSPMHSVVWARFRPKPEPLLTTMAIAPDELEVLDEILLEKP